MKLSDFLADVLAKQGLRHVFMITGGGAMHLNDALGKHADLTCVFSHHEQASAMAAESYARLSGDMAVLNVTTGPGGLNALNGVFGAYTDSIPMLVISGQVKRETMVESTGLPLRQLGDQECDIISKVKSMTKYAEVVRQPEDILFHLQKAIHLATTGRPGPVWLDIPLDIQAAQIDPAKCRPYEPEVLTPSVDDHDVDQLISRIRDAERPVMLVGTGVRISGQAKNLLAMMDLLDVPIVTAFNAHDLIANNHPNYAGRPGTVGDRPGNFAVQNSDCLVILGCRMNIRQVGYAFESFARAAYKIMVDIDPAEMQKQNLSIDWQLHADLAQLMPACIAKLASMPRISKQDWLLWCRERVQRYPVVLEEYRQEDQPMHPYAFMDELSRLLPEGAITVTGDGTACVAAFQSFMVKSCQRLYSNSGCASMGYDLPAAIGAHIASNEPVICLAGDGSIMMNLQELAQIQHHRYPIKIFLINNGGYVSIRQTQQNYFGMPFVGCGAESGVGFPDFAAVAAAFGLHYVKADRLSTAEHDIAAVLRHDGPVLCEVVVKAVPFAPKMASKKLEDGRMVSRPLEDMAPFLSREELMGNLLIDCVEE